MPKLDKIPKDITFLTVDDQTFYHSMVIDHLLQLGFKRENIFTAINATKGLEVMNKKMKEKKPIDFLMTDYKMPDITGTKMVKAIRKHKVYQDIPIIMLTTNTEQQAIVDAFEVGISTYMFKPWEIEELEEKILFAWDKAK